MKKFTLEFTSEELLALLDMAEFTGSAIYRAVEIAAMLKRPLAAQQEQPAPRSFGLVESIKDKAARFIEEAQREVGHRECVLPEVDDRKVKIVSFTKR